jgi:hypothetical protein
MIRDPFKTASVLSVAIVFLALVACAGGLLVGQ